MQRQTKQGETPLAFASGFIWVALCMAIGVGFSIGAHLTFTMGLGLRVGKGIGSFIQTHGHVQLIGWTGLFIMGISLHFFPRLAGQPLATPALIRWVLWLMTLGLGLRSVGQPLLSYLPNPAPVTWLVVGSGFLTWSGIILYVLLLLQTFMQRRGNRVRPALAMVRPYVAMMCLGWLVYANIDLALLVHMALRQEVVLRADWHHLATDSMVGLVVLPVAFAISVRTLPLYLRLAPLDWSVHRLAYAYGGALALQLLPTLPPLQALVPSVLSAISQCGAVWKSGVVLWFVWRLDILTRRHARTATPSLPSEQVQRAHPQRGSEAENFGSFAHLIATAYVWLVLAALWEGLTAAHMLLTSASSLNENVTRHLYLLGFSTLLIFGMAVRMLPGFWQQRRIASPALVQATLWLGNAAVLGRVLLFVVPTWLYDTVPGSLASVRLAFALSGLFGLAAVGCLALNLWRTAPTE